MDTCNLRDIVGGKVTNFGPLGHETPAIQCRSEELAFGATDRRTIQHIPQSLPRLSGPGGACALSWEERHPGRAGHYDFGWIICSSKHKGGGGSGAMVLGNDT